MAFRPLKGLFRLSLTKKFILTITVGYVALVAIFVLLVVHHEFSIFEREVRQNALSFSRSFALTAAHHLFSRDVATLREMVELASRERNISYIIVLDSDNRVLASSSPHLEMQVLKDEVSIKANKAMDLFAQRVGAVLDVTVPIKVGQGKMGSIRVGYSLKATQGLLANLRRAGVKINLASVLAGILIASLLTWHVTRALGKLIRATRRMAEGDLDSRVEIKTRDELEELGRSFNLMADRLKASREKLHRWNEELQDEVERRTGELKASEEMYRGLVEGANDAILLARIHNGEILEANPMAVFLTGRGADDLRETSLFRLFPPEQQEVLRRIMGDVVVKGRARYRDLALMGYGDSPMFVDASFSLVHYQGDPAIQGIFRDMSEQRKEERRKEALSGISWLVARYEGIDELIKFSADRLVAGFPLEEARIYIYPDLAEGFLKVSSPAAIESGSRAVSRMEGVIHGREDKGEASDVALPLVMGDEEVGILMVRPAGRDGLCREDIEALKLTANLLAVGIKRSQLGARIMATKNYLENILESSLDAIVTTDAKGEVTFASRATERILGYSVSDMLGKTVRTYIPKRDVIRLARLLRREGNVANFDTEAITREGARIPVTLSVSVLKDSQGRGIGFLGLAKDVRGLKVLQNQLIRAEKMAAVGELASAVAHEVRNPLAGISGVMQVLEGDFPAGDRRRKLIDELLYQVERLNKAVTNLLDFARPAPLSPVATDISELITGTLYFVDAVARKQGVKIHVELGRHLPSVFLDPEQMKQVFLNIILNALQAMPNEGQLTINTGKVRGASPSQVAVKFCDTGPGIAPDNLRKIFEPFFTTKQGGTGLGLSNSLKIVEQHGGSIGVVSAVGKGSTFTVTLPVPGPRGRRNA